MNRLNNKGFTLIEILGVIAIIAILGLIATPSILNVLKSSNNTTYNILIKNIALAGQQLYEELDNTNATLYYYDETGNLGIKIIIGEDKNGTSIEDGSLQVNLQTLVSNGLLTGNNNTDNKSNKNNKIITNPKNKEDIGICEIIITKIVDEKYNTSYQIKNNSLANNNCPNDSEYNNILN